MVGPLKVELARSPETQLVYTGPRIFVKRLIRANKKSLNA